MFLSFEVQRKLISPERVWDRLRRLMEALEMECCFSLLCCPVVGSRKRRWSLSESVKASFDQLYLLSMVPEPCTLPLATFADFSHALRWASSQAHSTRAVVVTWALFLVHFPDTRLPVALSCSCSRWLLYPLSIRDLCELIANKKELPPKLHSRKKKLPLDEPHGRGF